jgi:hypothetical protein
MSHPKFKKGDIVVVLEDIVDNKTTYLKAGEICEVTTFATGKTCALLQSLNPSFESGKWYSNVDNIDYALEMFKVLS